MFTTTARLLGPPVPAPSLPLLTNRLLATYLCVLLSFLAFNCRVLADARSGSTSGSGAHRSRFEQFKEEGWAYTDRLQARLRSINAPSSLWPASSGALNTVLLPSSSGTILHGGPHRWGSS